MKVLCKKDYITRSGVHILRKGYIYKIIKKKEKGEYIVLTIHSPSGRFYPTSLGINVLYEYFTCYCVFIDRVYRFMFCYGRA